VTRFALLFLAVPLLGQDVSKLLKTVETHYNHSDSVRLDFSESYAAPHHPVQKENGVLYLRKPGRMRWEYAQPAGKVFLSDGKDVFLYQPEDRKAEHSKLKQSEDMRAPLAFLLGKLDFNREFKSVTMSGANIVAIPKSDSLAYTKVEFQATPDGIIHTVNITGQDDSHLSFTFANEQQNVPLAQTLFTFRPPVGVEIVEAAQ
jgi:outer membrane lipoprotein carrier protein